jgi:hypothetical protein
MTKRPDLTVKAQIREVLSGLKGKERAAAKWWCECLAKADLPVWTRFGRYPGPHDIIELRARFADSDPELLEVFEESHRISRAEFEARFAARPTADGCGAVRQRYARTATCSR